MANASAKRIAAQNEKALQHLKLGLLLCNVVAFFVRLVIRKQSALSLIIFCVGPLLWTIFLFLFISKSGSPKRDAQGNLISSGADLSQAGFIEWSWDVLYITWICQMGSSILGERIWWFILIIPCYGMYKAWTIVIAPLFFNKPGLHPSQKYEPTESRRQEKNRKRQAKGPQK